MSPLGVESSGVAKKKFFYLEARCGKGPKGTKGFKVGRDLGGFNAV